MLIMQPLISIITVNFNNSIGLRETIESIEKQTSDIFEWIFIDGGSVDESVSLANSAKIAKKSIVSEPDRGIYDAMNKGIVLLSATSNYTIFLNSGDTLHDSNVIEDVKNFILKSRETIDLVYGGSAELTSRGVRFKRPRPLWYIHLGMPAHHQAMFFSSAKLKAEVYDLRYKIAADYALTCTYFKNKAKFSRLNRTVCTFGRPGLSLAKAGDGRAEAALIRKVILRDSLLINSAAYFFAFAMYIAKSKTGYFRQKVTTPKT